MTPPETDPFATQDLGPATVYLVDDEPVVREGLAWLLRTRRLLSEEFDSADAFADTVREGCARDALWPRAPACVLLDIRMPGTSGLQLFEDLAGRGILARLPVLFLTGHADVPTAVAAVKQGAFDFLEKPFSNNGVVDRLEAALRISTEAQLRLQAQERARRRLKGLTPREIDIAARICEGHANKTIAQALGLSVRTVEVHRASLYDKLQVHSVLALSHLLRNDGLGKLPK